MMHEKISAYFDEVVGNPHRSDQSWDHDYRFFRKGPPSQ